MFCQFCIFWLFGIFWIFCTICIFCKFCTFRNTLHILQGTMIFDIFNLTASKKYSSFHVPVKITHIWVIFTGTWKLLYFLEAVKLKISKIMVPCKICKVFRKVQNLQNMHIVQNIQNMPNNQNMQNWQNMQNMPNMQDMQFLAKLLYTVRAK